MSGPDRDRRRHRLRAARPDPLPRRAARRQGPPRRGGRGGDHRRPQRDPRRRHGGDRRPRPRLTGLPYMYGVAIAASLAVLVVMLAAVTLLPALLSYLGPKVDRLRLPFLGRRKPAEEGNGESPAGRWSHAVQRRPGRRDRGRRGPARAGRARARHAPRLPRRRQRPAEHDDPPGLRPQHRGLRPRHERAAGDRRRAAGRVRPAAIDALARRLRSEPGVAFVAEPADQRGGRRRDHHRDPETSPQDAETEDLVHRLRDDVVPQERSAAPGSPPRSAA